MIFKELKRPAKRKKELPTGGKDHKRRRVSAIGGKVSHQQTSVTVPADREGKYSIPDNGKPAVGGKASLQPTSSMVPIDGRRHQNSRM